jgi:hypothetical protein
MIWVAVKHVGGDSGSTEHPPEWIVSVAHERPFFAPSQWLKGTQSRQLVEKVFAAIESAVSIGPDISLHN